MIDMTREGKTLQAQDIDTLARLTRAKGWIPHGIPFGSVIEAGQFLQLVRRQNREHYRAWQKHRAAEYPDWNDITELAQHRAAIAFNRDWNRRITT